MTKITAHQLYQSAEIARLHAEIGTLKHDAELWRSFVKHSGHRVQAIMIEKHGAWKYFYDIDELKAFLDALK